MTFSLLNCILYLAAGVCLLATMFVLGACKAAGNADEWAEKAEERLRKESQQ